VAGLAARATITPPTACIAAALLYEHLFYLSRRQPPETRSGRWPRSMRASGSRACTRQAARRQRTLLVAMQAQWLPTRADVLAVPEAGRSASPWQRAPAQ
jgi:hypothetical protein